MSWGLGGLWAECGRRERVGRGLALFSGGGERAGRQERLFVFGERACWCQAAGSALIRASAAR